MRCRCRHLWRCADRAECRRRREVAGLARASHSTIPTHIEHDHDQRHGSLGALSDMAIRAIGTRHPQQRGHDHRRDLFLATAMTTLPIPAPGICAIMPTRDGDGVRDTEGVASADFGGGEDQFINSGTLSLRKERRVCGRARSSVWRPFNTVGPSICRTGSSATACRSPAPSSRMAVRSFSMRYWTRGRARRKRIRSFLKT